MPVLFTSAPGAGKQRDQLIVAQQPRTAEERHKTSERYGAAETGIASFAYV